MVHKSTIAPLPAVLLFALALSILTMPLALLVKVPVGASKFSISYLFICGIFAWTGLAAMRRIGTHEPPQFGRAAVLPGGFLMLVVLYTFVNGVDPAFLMSMLFWVGATYLGILIDHDLAGRIIKQMREIAFFATAVGIILYIANFPLLDFEALGSDMYFVNEWGHYRATSIFLNPNSFAYFLLFAFSSYCFGPERINRYGIVISLFYFVALLLSGSRSGFIAFALLLAFCGLQPLAPRLRFIAYSIANLILLATLVILVVFSDMFVGSDVRFEKWSFSMQMFLNSNEFWLTGIPADFELEKLGLFFSDNMFLNILFRVGIPGFIMFGFYYSHIIWRALRCLVWGDPVVRPLAAFLLVCSIPLFYSNFFYFYPLVLLHGVAVGQVLNAGQPTSFFTVNKKAVS